MSKRFRMSTALDVDDLLMECIPYAIKLANESFTKLCDRLKKNHKNDFDFIDLTLG